MEPKGRECSEHGIVFLGAVTRLGLQRDVLCQIGAVATSFGSTVEERESATTRRAAAGLARTLLFEDPQNFAACDVVDLCNAVRVAQVDADGRRCQALLGKLADVLNDLIRCLLEP